MLRFWTVHLETTSAQVPFVLTAPTAQAKKLQYVDKLPEGLQKV